MHPAIHERYFGDMDVLVIISARSAVTASMLDASPKLRGIVINGAVRDLDEIRKTNLPLYAAGITHRGPYKDGPDEINVPIAISGMAVEPGDLVIGDEDSVLTAPAVEAEATLAAAETKQAAEEKEIAAIHTGTVDRRWVDAALQAKGCAVEA